MIEVIDMTKKSRNSASKSQLVYIGLDRERDVVQAAWREWRECGSWRGDLDRDLYGPSRWFKQDELGLALDRGPSLIWTLSTLAKQHRSAAAQLGSEAPYRFTHEFDARRPYNRVSAKVTYSSRRRRGDRVSELLQEAVPK